MKYNVFLPKDAHGIADHFACPKMFIRVDFEGKQSNYKKTFVCKK